MINLDFSRNQSFENSNLEFGIPQPFVDIWFIYIFLYLKQPSYEFKLQLSTPINTHEIPVLIIILISKNIQCPHANTNCW